MLRLWGILSLIAVMGYSSMGWHHHVGMHVCLAYEHIFLNGACLYDEGALNHTASPKHCLPAFPETHHQGKGHTCICSVEYLSAIDRTHSVRINRVEHQVSPIWALLALTGLLLSVRRKSMLPDRGGVAPLLPPPLLTGLGLRAPPFLLF